MNEKLAAVSGTDKYWEVVRQEVNPNANEKAGQHGNETIKYLAEGDQELINNEGSNVPGWYRRNQWSCWIGPYLTSTDAFNHVSYP